MALSMEFSCQKRASSFSNMHFLKAADLPLQMRHRKNVRDGDPSRSKLFPVGHVPEARLWFIKETRRSSARPRCRRVVGMSQLQARQFGSVRTDYLDADRQTQIVKACWGGKRWTA